MSIAASFSTNLVSSIWTYMHDEGVVYSSLDPALIVRKVWPKNQEYTDLKTVWGSFFRFYGLPLPEDETVIKDCVKEGVRLGEFGLARGTPEEKEYTNILYEEMPFEIELSEDWYLITRELALELKIKDLIM